MPDYAVTSHVRAGSTEVWTTDMRLSDWRNGPRESPKRRAPDFPSPGLYRRAVVLCACEELSWMTAAVLRGCPAVAFNGVPLRPHTARTVAGWTRPLRLPVMLREDGGPTASADAASRLVPRKHVYVMCDDRDGRAVHIDLTSSQYAGEEENHVGYAPPPFMDRAHPIEEEAVEYGYMTIPPCAPSLVLPLVCC